MARSKYGAKRTVVNNITFASAKEAARYQMLVVLERAGQIKDLQLQVKFDLHVQGCKIGRYIADFVYVLPYSPAGPPPHGGVVEHVIVEDVKGMKTPMYRWKKKHLKAEYDIEIREV